MCPRCKLSLENERYIQVTEWKGELRVDIREWNKEYPMKKGVGLNLMQYNFLAGIEIFIDLALTENKEESFHLGANVFLKVRQDNPCVDIPQYVKPSSQPESVPTKRGLCLRPSEYQTLKTRFNEIEKHLPELENVVPCYMQDGHANQEGMLRCKYCNPDGYTKW